MTKGTKRFVNLNVMLSQKLDQNRIEMLEVKYLNTLHFS